VASIEIDNRDWRRCVLYEISLFGRMGGLFTGRITFHDQMTTLIAAQVRLFREAMAHDWIVTVFYDETLENETYRVEVERSPTN